MTPEELEKINVTRRGKEYFDKEAALEVYKDVRKQDLKESTFYQVSFGWYQQRGLLEQSPYGYTARRCCRLFKGALP